MTHLDDISLEHLVDLNGMRAALKTGESTLDQLFPEEKPAGSEARDAGGEAQGDLQGRPEDGGNHGISARTTHPCRMGREPLNCPPAQRLPFPLRPTGAAPTRTRKPSLTSAFQAVGDAAAAKGTRAP